MSDYDQYVSVDYDTESGGTVDFSAAPAHGRAAVAQALQAGVANTDDEPAAEPQFSGASTEPSSVSTQVMEGLNPYIQYLQAKWQIGEQQVIEGNVGFSAMMDPTLFQEAVRRSDPANIAQLRAMRVDPIEHSLWPWDLRRLAGESTQALPNIFDNMKGGLAGATAGATAGGAIGVATGPGVVATATTGAAFGFTGGMFAASARTAAGSAYLDLRKKGISHDQAAVIAAGVGAVNGAIETLEIGQLVAFAKNAVKKEVAKAVTGAMTKGGALKFMADYLKTVGLEGAEESAQELVSVTGEVVASMVSGNPDVMPKAKDVLDRVGQSFVGGVQASTLLPGVSHVAGKFTGKAAAAIIESMRVTGQVLSQPAAASSVKQATAQAAPAANAPNPKVLSGSVIVTQAAPPEDVAEAEAALARAEDDASQAADNVAEILAEMEQKFLKPEMRQALRDMLKSARIALREARDAVAKAKLNLAKARIEEKMTGADLTEEQQAGLKADADAVQEKLNQLAADAAERKLLDRATELKYALELTQSQIYERTHGRLDGVATEIDAVKAKIADLEIAGRKVPQKLTTQLAELRQEESDILTYLQAKKSGNLNLDNLSPELRKLENLAQSQEREKGNIELMAELAKEGLLTPAELRALAKKITTGNAQSLVNLAAQKIFKTGREISRSTRKNAKEVQKLLVELIDRSGLDLADRAKFRKMILAVQTTEDLVSKLPGIEAKIALLIEADARRDALAEISKQLGRSLPKGKGKQKKSRFDPESGLQEVLDLYRHYAGSGNADKVAETQTQYLDAYAKGEVTADLDERHAVATSVGVLKTKNSEQLFALAAELKQLIDEGLSERLAQIKERQAELKALKVEARATAQGLRPADTSPTASKERLMGRIGNLKRWGRAFGNTVFSWEGKLAILFQDVTNPKRIMELLSVTETVKKVDSEQRKQYEVLRGYLTKATGLKARDLVKLMTRGASGKIDTTYMGQLGETPLRVTRNEAITLWMQFQDESLHRGLREGNGYTFGGDLNGSPDSLQGVLERELSSDEKALARGLQAFYQAYFPRIADEFKRDTGMTLEGNEHYSGPAFRLGLKDELLTEAFSAQLVGQTSKSFGTGTPGTTIARVNSPLPLAPRDAFMNAMTHIAQVEHWRAWREAAKPLNAVFSDPEMRTIIARKYGDVMRESIKTHLQDMIQGHVATQLAWNDVAGKIMANAGTAFLALKPLQYIKQWTSLINFALHLPSADLLVGVADFFAHPVRAYDILSKSELFTDRYTSFDRTVLGALQRQDANALLKQNAKEWALFFLKAGDKHVSLAGGWAVYKYTLAQTGSAEKAMRAFEQSFNTTQSSGTIDQLSNLARNQTWKVLAIFMQQPMRLAEFQVTAWRKAANFPTPQNLASAVRTSLIIHIAQALFAAVDAAWILAISQDDDERDEAVWRVLTEFIHGPLFPIWGDMLNGGVTLAENLLFDKKFQVFAPKVIPLEVGAKTLTMVQKIGAALADGEIDPETELIPILLDYARGPNLLAGGLPLDPPLKLLKRILDNEGNLFAGLGQGD